MAMHLLVRLNVLIVLSSPQVSGRVVVSDFSHWHQECYVNRSYTLFTSWLNSTYVRQPLDWCRVCVAGWIREAVTVSLCYSAVIKSVVVVSAFCLFVVWQSRFWWYRRESCVTFIVSFLLVVMCWYISRQYFLVLFGDGAQPENGRWNSQLCVSILSDLDRRWPSEPCYILLQ